MSSTEDMEVYLAEDIAKILKIGRSKAYEFLDEIHDLNEEKKDPPFTVRKIGKLIRVPKHSFDSWFYQ